MRYRFSIPVICVAIIAFLTAVPPVASAQPRLDIFVTPIPNAPFSGIVQVQRSVVQPDGSVQDFKTTREIGRDSQGRIYNELRTLVPLSFVGTPQLLGVHLYDPQTRTSTRLDPNAHIFWTGTVNRPPETVPPALLYASPTGTNLPQHQFVKQEDLGVHEIDGVSAHGVRVSQSIPAESSGTGKEILTTDEYWYSEDLRINLILRHSDPRTGSVTMSVTKIQRTDPDPSRFQIPEGYKPAPFARGMN
jgi:hypothetical protein